MKYQKTLISLALSCLIVTTPSLADTSVGAYVEYDGWSVNTIDQFNADTIRPAATVNVFSTFNHSWNHLFHQAGNIVSRSAVPMITWMPYNSQDPESNVLAEISQGQWDSYINDWIEGFKSWRSTYNDGDQPSVLIRFGHEFNGNWYPWADKPEDLKSAWRYLHSKFADAGLNDVVGWVWCANNVDVDSHNDITAYYPGNDVVDWLSIDGYNWGSNYSFTRWKSFDETFSQSYVKMVTNFPGKPVMLAEVSSAEPHDIPDPSWGQDGDDSDALQSKKAWIADMMQRIQTSYPAIQSIVWFNTNKELGWALNQTGNTGLMDYNDAVMEDYFGGQLSIKPSSLIEEPVEAPVQEVKGNNGNKGNKDRLAKSSDEAKLTGIARAVSVSNMPAVIGERLLAKEAEGFRKMNPETLKAMKQRGLLD